ncbi:MAG: hypothetical protein AAF518_23760 [Spirochaetota bacterium]
MEKKMEVRFTIKPVWDTLSQIRDDIQKFLQVKNVDEDVMEKADVVCLELLENAVKYGIGTPDSPDVNISFKLEENMLVFYVSNGVRQNDNLQFLFDLIDKINSSDDVEALYLERLQEIAKNPKNGSQLGVYRIVYESEFSLKYNLEGTKLTLEARKTVERKFI